MTATKKLTALTDAQRYRMPSVAQSYIEYGWRTEPLTYSEWQVWDAGARAYNRWAHDTFGGSDRLLLVGAIGSCADMDATIAELDWACRAAAW